MRHHPTWAEVKQEFMSTSVPINATCATCRYSPPPATGWPTTNGERTGHFLPRCA